MGGVVYTAQDQDALTEEVSWTLPHGSLASPWSRYALRRYGSGFAPTGLAESVAVPRLLRLRTQDWLIHGFGVRLGPDFVSFGRELSSSSQTEARTFYGVDVYFGQHSRSSWFWYCKSTEWLLLLHQVILEPIPEVPGVDPGSIGTLSLQTAGSQGGAADMRWPGKPRYLTEETAPSGSKSRRQRATSSRDAQVVAQCATSAAGVAPQSPDSGNQVDKQLSFLMSNADGHVGLLSLPVPRNKEDAAKEAIAQWSSLCVTPLRWGGDVYSTPEDFRQLREHALNMPDILLLGLEAEMAMVLTPDWTWEKYPRGFGEAAFPDPVVASGYEDEDVPVLSSVSGDNEAPAAVAAGASAHSVSEEAEFSATAAASEATGRSREP
mmetsp:Transcript_3217/g.7717  ORF Transcript_3217/g.7717 Transcript_3217/m.7717 type:complete len:379 (-) Transcript_3217:255-1391(-)